MGGAKAVVYLSQKIWWARPIWALSHLPLIMDILDYIYEQIAKKDTVMGSVKYR